MAKKKLPRKKTATKKTRRVLVNPTPAEVIENLEAVAKGDVVISRPVIERALKKKAALAKKKKQTALALVEKAKPSKPRRRRAPTRFVIEDPSGLLEPRLPAPPMLEPVSLTEEEVVKMDGLSELKLTPEEARICMAPILWPEEVEPLGLVAADHRYYIPVAQIYIRPDGAVYHPQVWVRRRLSLAFGPGQWGLRPTTTAVTLKGTAKGQWFELKVRGKTVGRSMGEQNMHDDNIQQSEATVTEGIQSSALVRCCKNLNIAFECWDASFTWKYQSKMCLRVWREKKQGKAQKPQWRRIDQPPWWDEKGVCADSPNRKQYVGPYDPPEGPQPDRSDERDDDPRPSNFYEHDTGQPERGPEEPQGGGGGGGGGGGRRAVKISEPQVRRLRAIAKEAGWPESDDASQEDNFPQLHRAIEGTYGIEHLHDIVRGKYKGEYDDIIEAIESGGLAVADYVDGYEA